MTAMASPPPPPGSGPPGSGSGPPQSQSMPAVGSSSVAVSPVGVSDTLAAFIAQFKQVSDAVIDSWFVVDNDRNIVDFNRTFYGMLPRAVARGLRGKKCYD